MIDTPPEALWLGIVLSWRLSRIEKAVITLTPPSETYERGSGDQSRLSPPSERMLLETVALLKACRSRDSSRGLSSTGYYRSTAIRRYPELIVGAPGWAKPSAPSLDALKTAYDHVSVEMNVLLSIRVFSCSPGVDRSHSSRSDSV